MMSVVFLYILFVAIIGLPLVANTAAITVTNDVTVTLDKDNYSFEKITCHLSGLLKINDVLSFWSDSYKQKRDNIKIVSVAQLQLPNNGITNLLTDVADYSTTTFSTNNYDTFNVTLKLNVKHFFGPKFLERINFNGYGQEIDNGYTKLNTSWIPAGPYRCIVINNGKSKVLGASESFTYTGPPEPAIIKVLTTSVLPGQVLYADVYNPNYTAFTFISGDYLRVYKVPYDVSNNLTELNTVGGTAKFISSINFQFLQVPYYHTNFSAIAEYISWKEPGKYQIVMLSDYNQVFRGISNVFEVGAITRSKNTTVTVEPNSTFTGQNFTVTIYKPDPPYGSRIGIAYIAASHKVIDYVNGIKKWVSYEYNSGTWSSNTTNLTITTSFHEGRFGLYKVVVLAGDIVIGVSKPLQIKRPNLQILKPLPKRVYSQYESIPIIVNGSYSDYAIISRLQPDSYYNTGEFPETLDRPEQHGYQIYPNRTLVIFTPGIYNIRKIAYKSWWGNNSRWNYQLDYVISIPNTTFRVIRNNVQIMIADNKSNYNYGEQLNFALTTTNKVPLHGPIEIYANTTYWRRNVATLQDLANTSNTLYGTIPIATYIFGCQYEHSPLNVQLHTWSFEIVYSSKISIIDTSCPTR